MRLEHVMTREAVLVHPADPVVVTAKTMRERNTSSVLVVDDAGALVGILTERDLVHKIVAEGQACDGLTVGDLMTPNPITADPLDRVWEGARKMSEHRIRHLPVTQQGRPIGVVSHDDIRGMETEPRPTWDVIRGLHASSQEQTLDIDDAPSDLGEIIPAWY